ncbi:hypothetical protein HHK36_014079 [Tetracentron sinense]|uniref:DUF632 domain-containing protein n=1 Tax=Tetracentron sinense TaxID=13715 RepID=A0A834ZEE2_TETSI|nr:hypothetical protein HHK36_014079 [Tetracentron sinense]
MGCTQSKIENEEAVTRCKDRKMFMKNAVSTRNAFAAAHSAYTMALKNTGAALSDYGQCEVQDIRLSQSTPKQPMETLPPPPPLPDFSPISLQRTVSMPELSIPKSDQKPADTILEEEEDEDDNEDDNTSDLLKRTSRGGGRIAEEDAPQSPQSNPVPPPPPESKGMAWDYFFSTDENMPGPSLSELDETMPDKDEGHSGMYDIRFKRMEDSVSDGDVGGKSSMVEPETPEKAVGPAVKTMKRGKQIVHTAEAKRGVKVMSNGNLLQVLTELDDHFLKASESAYEVSKMLEANRMHYHSNFADNRGHIDHSARVMRVITWNRSFRGMQNADDGKDDFDAEEHETHATVLDKLLAWEKKLYDEVKVCCLISFGAGGKPWDVQMMACLQLQAQSLGARMVFYDSTLTGELMKLEYQRKVALLNKQKKRGTSSEALEKTKAAVSHLHTRYIVDMQSMDSTVSEINRLRDEQLYPKLVEVVEGMANMWETMFFHHGSQLKIVSDLRYLDISHAPKETTEQHHARTTQLCGVVQEWHSQFEKLVSHQKEYIKALNGWLKLNLIPIESSLKEKVSSPPREQHPPIQALLRAWHDTLEKLPDELARSAVSSFAAIIKAILMHQKEEMKLKEKCEETGKEFERKKRAFEDWSHKYMQRRGHDEMDPEGTEDANHKDPIAERQFAVETLKKRLEEEVEDHRRHCIQVREKSLGSLKTHLPELFRAMSDFAHACSDMYKNLRSISQFQDPTESPS